MKKNYISEIVLKKNNQTKHIFRIMRLTLFLLLIFSGFMFANNVNSQNARVSLNKQREMLSDVLKEIENQTDYLFVSNREINLNQSVSIRAKNKPVKEVLDNIFNDTDLYYAMEGVNIILSKKTVSESVTVVAQQKRTITGTVIDNFGEPIIGANIVEKGTTNGIITDVDGKFSISIGNNAVLRVSYIGFIAIEVNVENQSNLTITLNEDTQALDEVIVIGYGTVRKSDLTGAVGTIKGDNMKAQGVSNVTTSLQGRLPGVTIESSGGTPGAGARVLIRGVGTFGNANPLYLVDGVPVDNIRNIPAGDIESMNILKDASAAAIYGSRAANGVVLVTTKNGSSGVPIIQFEGNIGFQSLAKKTDVLDAQGWATVNNAAHDAAGLARLDIASNPSSLGKGTDWQDAVYRTAPIQQYQLNISGGSDNVKYSISGGYNNQKGIVETTGYDRFNVRMKFEATKGIFKIGETFMAAKENWGNKVPGGWGSRADAVGAALLMIPVFDIYDPDAVGGFAGAYGPVVNIGNPLAMLNLQNIEENAVSLINNSYVEVSLLPFLKYKFNVGYTWRDSKNSDYTHRYTVGTLFSNLTNNLSESIYEQSTILLENTLSFDKKIGKHNIQALAGYSYQKYNNIGKGMANKNLPDGINVLDAARENPTAWGNKNESVLLSLLGRAIYSYDDKYLLTATFRRDGSSRFASSNRYGNFPSVALGWNIYRENFFNNLNIDQVVSMLKLRGSYGVLGNQEIGNYLYSASIANNINYVIGSNQQRWVGAIQTNFATTDIRWETTKTINVGLDASFFQNALTLTFDWFDKQTHDILLAVPIPLSAGAASNPTVNAGKISNKGIEIGLNYNGKVEKLTYNVFGTVSHVKNKIIELGTGTQQIFGGVPMLHAASTTIAQAGGEVGAFYLREMIGIFQSEAEVQAYSKDGKLIQPNAKPGDVKFFDANDDGVINDLDRVNCGSPFPDVEFSFGFDVQMHGFDLGVYFQGVAGNKIYNGMRHELEGMTLEQNYSKATLNAWTPENKSTKMPRAVINDPNYNSYSSSRYLENGSYLRLKTLQIGYNFEKSLIQKIRLNGLRAYVSANNLFTITDYSGSNPDLGGSGDILNRGVDFSRGSYPLARTVSFGIQLSL